MLQVKVRPKLKTAQRETTVTPPPLRLLMVCDWQILGQPALGGLAIFARNHLIAGERLLVVQGPPPTTIEGVEVELDRSARAPLLGVPLPPELLELDRIVQSCLRDALVSKLTAEKLPVLGLTGFDLGCCSDERAVFCRSTQGA